MRRYSPSARTDQEAEYRTSGHGKALLEKGDTFVANCVSCHSHHGILAVDDQNSPVYPTHVAQTCSTCHSDEKLMAGREYNGRPLGHEQYAKWSASVHGKALLEKGDLSAPTCNDCHGNHGALPPEIGSVANACATCHGKVGKLFAETQMKHKFQEVGLPGCATCHGSHGISAPTDAMLGMTEGAVCATCHKDSKYGATLAGADAAETMRKMMEDLKARIATAEATIEEAERLGMQVGGSRFDLRQANDALTNARSLIHSFALAPVKEALDEGNQVAAGVQAGADAALKEHTFRRIWLAAFLIPVLIVVVLLALYVRTAFPVPSKLQGNAPEDH
jgi:predicted CXXCH cytochrome family protein